MQNSTTMRQARRRGRCGGLLLALAPLVSGCVIETRHGPPPAPEVRRRPPHRAAHPDARPPRPAPARPLAPAPSPVRAPARRVAPPLSRTAPEALPDGIADGRPRGFEPGAPAAFWIWRGPRGQWRLRTTTERRLHTFGGHVQGVSAPLVDVTPTRQELSDAVWSTPDGWALAFQTQGHADGFSFASADGGCVRFDLQIDGGGEVKRVFIGAAAMSPASNHFVLCPSGRSQHPKSHPLARPPVLRPAPPDTVRRD